MTRRIALIAMLCLGMLGTRAALAAEAQDVKDILAKVPADTVVAGQQAIADLVKLGPDGIKQVIAMVVAPGSGNDTKARFALMGLSYHVCRPGAEAERTMYAKALIEAVESDKPTLVKSFLISQLQLVGRDEAVATLAKCLNDADLLEPATQALLKVNTPAAGAALAKALPTAKDANRATIIRALGELRVAEAAAAILPYAQADDVNTRRTALYALARIGDPASAGALAKAADAKDRFERTHATAMYLRYAQRLAETGNKEQCLKICRELAKSRADETNVATNALATIWRITGADSIDELMPAAGSENKQLRDAVLSLIAATPGDAATAKLAARLAQAPADQRPDIIDALGARADALARAAVLAALKDSEKNVRLAAIPLAARQATPVAIAALVDVIKTAGADDAKPAAEALARIPGDQVLNLTAAAISSASPAGRVGLIQVLASRRAKGQIDAVFTAAADADANVRVAAINALGEMADAKALPRVLDLLLNASDARTEDAAQSAVVAVTKRNPDAQARIEPLLAAMSRSSGARRIAMMKVLSRVGGQRAVEAVAAEARGTDAQLSDGAVRALSEWTDAGAAPELLTIARSASRDTHQVLALRGYLRLAALPANRGQAAEMYKQAAAVAKRPDEKRMIISGLGNVRNAAALKLVATYLDDEALSGDAAMSAVRITLGTRNNDRALEGADVLEVMKKVAETAKDQAVRDRATKYVDSHKQ